MSAEWWQNFANNFATDLAPLISLFGESPTKQYLSETLTFVDVFIFCMAPIGVLTALVSAIRVAGGPSLRAFIGRAQEGAGMAEAELCSSTSRNVCELYNNGGIARVFGRPKILELVHDWEGKSEPQPNEENWKPRNETKIYSFREYVNRGHWRERVAKAGSIRNKDEESRPGEDPVKPIQYSANDFAPHPNLSLNVGIKKLPRISFYMAAVLGFVLQAGVLVYAGLITYKYPNWFKRDDSQIAVPAFPFACAGTVLVCIGVGICASIIERTTYEKTFERTKDTSRLYWIQPGDQIVGDQVFDCFAYSDAKNQIKEYTTSKREVDRDNDAKLFLAKQSVLVWVASLATTIGFALQFLGLRALHSTVSVAQFGAILVMTTVRASLRTRRLKEEDNLLGNSSTLYLGHELDWLAMEMAQEDQHYFAQGVPNQTSSKTFWHVAAERTISPQKETPDSLKNKAVRAYRKRTKLAQMTGALSATSTIAVREPWQDSMIASRTWAAKLACAIEGVMKTINLRCKVKHSLSGKEFVWNLRCWMDTVPDTSSSKSDISLTIARDTEGPELYGPWKADRAQLESVIGLWLWSIISTEGIRRNIDEDSPGANGVTRASRLISILEDSDSIHTEANLSFWLRNKGIPIAQTELLPESAAFQPGSLWVEEPDKRLRERVSKNFRKEQRLFGSSVIPGNIINNFKGASVKALHALSASSLEMMCTQELFTVFFTTVVQEIDDIGGGTKILQGPDRLSMVNSTLSEMIENFASSGIGNYDDAIACIVPVLHSAQQLIYSRAPKAVRARSEEHRQKKEWEEAQNEIFPVLDAMIQSFKSEVIPLPGDTDRTQELHICLLSLCDLYRQALLEDNQTRLFGILGYISLLDLFDQSNRRWPTGANDKIDDDCKLPRDLLMYRNVALNLAKDEKDDVKVAQAMRDLRNHPGGRNIPYSEILEDFHGALHQANLEGALYALKPSVLSSCTGRLVLAKAAQHGWYPVMKSLQGLGIDTREVDHNGLNYLHHAVQSCNAVMLNELIGNDMDLLQRRDNFGREPLHLAAAAGRTDVVLLLNRRFFVKGSVRDKFFRSPLDSAILSDHSDTFNLLSELEKAENANSRSEQSWEPEIKWLIQAVCCGSINVVLRLLDTIISNSIGTLHPAKNKLKQCKKALETNEGVKSQNLIEILKILKEHSYSAEEWQIEGRTAISFAAEANKVDLLTYLLQNCSKTSITVQDNNGRTCLHHAVISQSESAVEALINLKYADGLLRPDSDRLGPLEYALIDRSFTIASMLLREDSRGKNWILPGTALAAIDKRLYFQDTDSQIRSVPMILGTSKHALSQNVFPVSSRLFTPLAAIGATGKYRLFYVSKEDILSDLWFENGHWSQGSLQKAGARVGKRSSLAACRSGHGSAVDNIFYQDKQGSICRIFSPLDMDDQQILREPLTQAIEGSGIAVLANENTISVYFQRTDFEVEKRFVAIKIRSPEPFVGKSTILPMHGLHLQQRTPLLCFPLHGRNSIYLLFCDNKGQVRSFTEDRTLSEIHTVARMDSGPTQLALHGYDVLVYQSKLGDIWQGFISDSVQWGSMMIASVQAPVETD